MSKLRYCYITLIHIEAQEIYIHCYQSELESYGASGPDGIPSQLLKELFTYIATVFVLIFNALLHQGKFPLDWKTATVVLIIRKAVTLTLQIIGQYTFVAKFLSMLYLQLYLNMHIIIIKWF